MNAHAMYNSVQNLDREALVAEHSDLVKRIAFHLLNRLPPSVQAEDLVQLQDLLQEPVGDLHVVLGRKLPQLLLDGVLSDLKQRCAWEDA